MKTRYRVDSGKAGRTRAAGSVCNRGSLRAGRDERLWTRAGTAYHKICNVILDFSEHGCVPQPRDQAQQLSYFRGYGDIERFLDCDVAAAGALPPSHSRAPNKSGRYRTEGWHEVYESYDSSRSSHLNIPGAERVCPTQTVICQK